MLGRLTVLASLLALGMAAPAHAATVTASTAERGWVSLTVAGSQGERVDLAELDGNRRVSVGRVTLQRGRAVLRHASRWRCDRFVRRFQASSAQGVTISPPVRTPSCKRRLALSVRHSGRSVAIRVTDSFGVGDVAADFCTARPGGSRDCRRLRIIAGSKFREFTYAARPGLWPAAVATAWGQRLFTQEYVRPSGRPLALATGDSMIEYVDVSLEKGLGKRGFKVRSDTRISTGISKPFLLNWPAHAKRQVRSRPDVTVVFIGANDGYSFGDTDCCGHAWVNAYALRVRRMMLTYSRERQGLVYWLTLPAARPAQWHDVYPAVNRAIFAAAASLAGAAHVVDLAKALTPGGRFRSSMRWKGRRVTVRQGDGIHLSLAGASIAEALIERAMRADGAIG